MHNSRASSFLKLIGVSAITIITSQLSSASQSEHSPGLNGCKDGKLWFHDESRGELEDLLRFLARKQRGVDAGLQKFVKESPAGVALIGDLTCEDSEPDYVEAVILYPHPKSSWYRLLVNISSEGKLEASGAEIVRVAKN